MRNSSIPVVFSANDFYVPYLATVMQSVMDCSSRERDYSLIVLTRDITEENKALLQSMVQNAKHFTLTIIDVTEMMEKYEDLYISNHIKIETYYRLLVQDILPDIDKILYIDCDTIVKTDVGELYDIDIDGYYLAATRDADNAALYYKEPDRKEWSDHILGIKEPYNYFQAGVMALNLKLFREEFTVKYLMDLAASRDWHFHDQDVLNYLCKDKVKLIDYAWNFVFDLEETWSRSANVIAKGPHFVYEEYMKARENPKIIHFSWNNKPWHSPGLHLAHEFWRCARETPFYSLILARMELDLTNFIFNKNMK
jgi:lipopolysaccharide biosynthesis glycosyltransferase